MWRINQFQIAHSELVQPHIAVFLYAVDGADMLGAVVLGVLQVIERSTRSNHALGQFLHTEPFQRCSAELLIQQLIGKISGKHPVVEGVGVVFLGKMV